MFKRYKAAKAFLEQNPDARHLSVREQRQEMELQKLINEPWGQGEELPMTKEDEEDAPAHDART